MPLKQLTDLLGIDRSSVFRLANTLRQRRFLANPKGRKDYILGPSAWRLSRKYGRSVLDHVLSRAPAGADRELRARRRTSRCARAGRRSSSITTRRPDRSSTVSGQTGEFVPLYCTAHGKALLADFDLAESEGRARRRAAAGLLEEHDCRLGARSRRSCAEASRRRLRDRRRRVHARKCAAWRRRFAIRTARSSRRSASPRRRRASRRALPRSPPARCARTRARHQRLARWLTRRAPRAAPSRFRDLRHTSSGRTRVAALDSSLASTTIVRAQPIARYATPGTPFRGMTRVVTARTGSLMMSPGQRHLAIVACTAVAVVGAAGPARGDAQSSRGAIGARTAAQASNLGGLRRRPRLVEVPSTSTEITPQNVGRLQVAWTYPVGDNNVYQFNPIVVDSTMYVLAKNSSLVALDARDGQGALDPRRPARHRAPRHQLLGEPGSARIAACSSRSTTTCRRSTRAPASRS